MEHYGMWARYTDMLPGVGRTYKISPMEYGMMGAIMGQMGKKADSKSPDIKLAWAEKLRQAGRLPLIYREKFLLDSWAYLSNPKLDIEDWQRKSLVKEHKNRMYRYKDYRTKFTYVLGSIQAENMDKPIKEQKYIETEFMRTWLAALAEEIEAVL